MDIPREQLYAQINERVNKMMQSDLLAEAVGLYPFRNLQALQTVGYTELFEHIEKRISLDRAVELIMQHTRNYAKRQYTWFRRQPPEDWPRLATQNYDVGNLFETLFRYSGLT